MPGIMGIIADKWLRAERAYMLCHLVCAGALLYATTVTDPQTMFWVMLVNAMAYMPTIALSNSVSYSCLAKAGQDPVTSFPPVRVFGTIGFIVAMWTVRPDGAGTEQCANYTSLLAHRYCWPCMR
ncbi:nucleoside permease [Salmonella enterica subsp. enterica]|uniref:Nucleoside permease n=1 Tax=Salmonella enterica I TaxID=59201 RepID=A0A3S4JCM5_SALET|nr:nucleoside permease [Salmonella enterica subsp. enterica]